MTDAELLALHRELVAIPSVSGDEEAICTALAAHLEAAGGAVRRFGNNLVAVRGQGPVVCLNSHVDTVPPAAGWSRDPWLPEVIEGKVYGLGANDAKAAVAAMVAAFSRLGDGRPLRVTVVLTLVEGEETGGKGTEAVLPELAALGLPPAAVVVGEPTGLDVVNAQKGLLVLELRAVGTTCHAAHATALGATNAIRSLARDLLSLEEVDLGPADPVLGRITVEPTVVRGGQARNVVPGEASCILDVRANPVPSPAEVLARLRAAIDGEMVVLSERLRPCSTPDDHPLVKAALEARPEARLRGSRGLSDLVFFRGIPGVKAGPGVSERSHTADEFVLESEVTAGASFYVDLVRRWQDVLAPEEEP